MGVSLVHNGIDVVCVLYTSHIVFVVWKIILVFSFHNGTIDMLKCLMKKTEAIIIQRQTKRCY